MKSEQPRLILVAADFNKEIVEAMIAAAVSEAESLGVSVLATARVQGCYELPFAVDAALSRADCELLAVLGYIERGETLHGEVMGHVVCRTLIDLSLKYGKPVGLGIIGPGATHDQAVSRRESHARNAVRAANASLSVRARLGA